MRKVFLFLCLFMFCSVWGYDSPSYGARRVRAELTFRDVPAPEERISLTDEELALLPPVALNEDSSSIYEELILAEHKRSSVVGNVIGITAGSILTIGGAAFIIYALTIDEEEIEHEPAQNLGEAYAYTVYEGTVSYAQKVAIITTVLVGVALEAAGIPLLCYNLHSYGVHSEHRKRRDQYYREYDLYRMRREWTQRNAVKVMVSPAIDVANFGAGMNMHVLF